MDKSKPQSNGHDLEVADINLRILAAAAAFASKDETRYYLNGVCIEIEQRSVTYIGTDGHRLVCYREESEEDARDNHLIGAFIIPTAHCKSFKLDKDDEGRASVHESHGRLTIAHNMVDVTFVPIEGVYPNWRKSIPRTAASGTLAQYNFKYLDDFRKFADALGLPTPYLAPNGDGPGLLWFTSRPEVLGLVMPYRAVEQIGQRAPSWAVRGGPAREQSDIEDDDMMRHPVDGDGEPIEHDPATGEVTPPTEHHVGA